MTPSSRLRRGASRLVLFGAATGLTLGATAAPADAQSPDYAFAHGEVTLEPVDQGDTAQVRPSVLQEAALPDDTAALYVQFTDSFHRIGINLAGAEVQADYDNCIENDDSVTGGVLCAVTDFEDSPGTAFTIDEDSPVIYSIDEDTVGPIDACGCSYSVKTIDSEGYDTDFGDLTWSDDSDNLFALTAEGDASAAEGGERFFGDITIPNTENPFDLAVEGVNVAGDEGDEVTVTVPVTNSGPAPADDRTDSHGSYEARAQLPSGLELVTIDSDIDEPWSSEGWSCFGSDSLSHEYDYQQDRTELDRFDLACTIRSLEVGATEELTFTVRITDATSAADGLIEVRETFPSPHTDSLDGDLSDNLAPIGVNAEDDVTGGGEGDGDDDASGKLPATGTPMTILISAAAAVLAAGAVMFVVMRRRKAATDW